MTTASGDMTSAFSAALESAATAPEVSPASQTVTEPTPAAPATETATAAATAQPAESEQPPTSASPEAPAPDPNEQTKGEPPKWRWQDILANARETSAKETEARVRQEMEAQYGGLKDFATLAPDERAGLAVWHKALNGDPHSRALVSQAQPKLAVSMGWTAAPAEDAMPEPDLQTGDGTPVYSASQQAKREAWLERRLEDRLLKQFDQRLQPVQQVVAAHRETQAKATVSSVIADLKAKSPEFDAYKKDVGAALQADADLWALADTNPRLAVETAWHRVFVEKVLPQRDRDSEAKVLANLQQKAAATTVNPGTPANANTPDFTKLRGEAAFKAALEHHGR